MSGVSTYLELVTKPTPLSVLNLAYVRDQHLRSPNGNLEDEKIAKLIETAYRRAERVTQRALAPQTWTLNLDRFPLCGEIVLPKPPLISVESIVYVDDDGVEQTWSDALYTVVAPSGPYAAKGRILPAYDESWPTTRCVPNAVQVTFRCGYSDGGSPEHHEIPEDIQHGMLLVIGELYKQTSESVHAFNQNPAMIRSRDLFMDYRAY